MSLVRFKKEEINQIMEIYSKKISIGEWKDYSICFQTDCAIFSIHRSYSVGPLFQITKKHLSKSPFMLSSRNSVIVSSRKLKPLLSYLKKPSLKLVR
ncbi:MAG: hypothetical protein CL572_00195 [Alphaproteobacteria bacterium]|nr:hypothetical protein [Alphaproteobacteria bacterium]|tara:strand:+ start:770 stop:1060 length:291 start_codon:yes stop_codon:yes gene_type:complete